MTLLMTGFSTKDDGLPQTSWSLQLPLEKVFRWRPLLECISKTSDVTLTAHGHPLLIMQEVRVCCLKPSYTASRRFATEQGHSSKPASRCFCFCVQAFIMTFAHYIPNEFQCVVVGLLCETSGPSLTNSMAVTFPWVRALAQRCPQLQWGQVMSF